MMIDILSQDLALTVLVPSEEAFKRYLPVPPGLSAANVKLGELVNYDLLSEFPLNVSKDIDGMLVVNRIQS
ncbi:hypothetical protein VNO80_05847 [Phaseolus coccineus]|uniref:FAS1 domain-containing protein n=1 Tax=Phaseolus coccineus TaxID=3886 RepID=A0AAN9RIG1_PHACN